MNKDLNNIDFVTDNNLLHGTTINTRNTEKKWSRSDAVVNHIITCSKCGKHIDQGEAIVWTRKGKYNIFGNYTYKRVVSCTTCCNTEDLSQRFRLKHCNTCGRPIYKLKYDRVSRYYFCCHGCQYTYYNKKDSHTRRENRVKTCPVCGAVFGAKRSDTKYCSNGCKQKHFREYDRTGS